jgi:hypothetical protein
MTLMLLLLDSWVAVDHQYAVVEWVKVERDW